MADPYQILGVSRDATSDDIRQAYRTLAKKHHPDLNPGNKEAEARFKAIASAYAIVGDEAKRALFDSGKIDATGAEQQAANAGQTYRQHAEAQPGFKYERHWGGDGVDEDDLFAGLFGEHARRAVARGSDIHYTFSVDFVDAAVGAKRRVVMADGKALDVTIPAGLADGQTLRLRGQGNPGHNGAPAGDALLVVHVKPHPVFRREANDIRSILPVTLAEGMAGAKVAVQTITGMINVTVPKGSNTGTTLRLRGKGIVAHGGTGDHLIELRVVLPPSPDEDFIKAVADWEAKHPYNPRASLGEQP